MHWNRNPKPRGSWIKPPSSAETEDFYPRSERRQTLSLIPQSARRFLAFPTPFAARFLLRVRSGAFAPALERSGRAALSWGRQFRQQVTSRQLKHRLGLLAANSLEIFQKL